jgi:hypothetical protein
MSPDVAAQLESIAETDDFAARSSELVEAWSAEDSGVERVEPILKFIEGHQTLDFGSPGPLVHYVERFYGNGYEQRLIESLERKPTTLTTWMLNRVVNGTNDPIVRGRMVELMKRIEEHPLADGASRDAADRFLKRLSS